MSVASGTMTVGTASVQVDGNDVNPMRIYIRNNDSTKTLYLGNGDVTPANGFPIDKLSTQDFILAPGDRLHMISTDAGHSISWLRFTV